MVAEEFSVDAFGVVEEWIHVVEVQVLLALELVVEFPVVLDVPVVVVVVVGAEVLLLLLAEVPLVVAEEVPDDVVFAEHVLEVELVGRLAVEVVDPHRRRNHKKLLWVCFPSIRPLEK